MDKNKNGMNAFWALIGGVILGAGVVLFSDEKQRNKIKRGFNDLKEKGADEIENLKKGLESGKERVKDRLSNELKKAQKKVDGA